MILFAGTDCKSALLAVANPRYQFTTYPRYLILFAGTDCKSALSAAILGGPETIRDFIAFPKKNNSGRDVMIDAPSVIDERQLEELHIKLR